VKFVFSSDHPRVVDVKSRFGVIALAVTIALTGCRAPAPTRDSHPDNPESSVASPQSPVASPHPEVESRESHVARHDLSRDEAMGGHTLARHVGKTDEELIERLRREPDISSASTYTDRETAERVIEAALASGGSSFQKWRARQGRRPNFVLHYDADEAVGRSIRRGHTSSVPCERAVVVLRWDDRRQQMFVLTSYPEENR
jgi:hypothetical protein